MTAREPTSAAELAQRYREAHRRLWQAQPPPPSPPKFRIATRKKPPQLPPSPGPEAYRYLTGEWLAGPPDGISREQVQRAVCRYYHIARRELRSERRTGDLVLARHVFFHLCRNLTSSSFPDIGRFIGRDHSTVIYGAQRIELLIATNVAVAADIQAIRTALGAGS